MQCGRFKVGRVRIKVAIVTIISLILKNFPGMENWLIILELNGRSENRFTLQHSSIPHRVDVQEGSINLPQFLSTEGQCAKFFWKK
jgi:hypothetical protein